MLAASLHNCGRLTIPGLSPGASWCSGPPAGPSIVGLLTGSAFAGSAFVPCLPPPSLRCSQVRREPCNCPAELEVVLLLPLLVV